MGLKLNGKVYDVLLGWLELHGSRVDKTMVSDLYKHTTIRKLPMVDCL